MSFDAENSTHIQELNFEMFNDPEQYGYEPQDTHGGLSIINLERPEIIVTKERISAAAIRSTCTYDAYNNLSIDEQEWIRWITGSGGADTEDVEVTADLRQQLAGDPVATDSIWAVANRDEMNAAMLALMDVEGTRAEELWGYGSVISRDDWTTARDV